MAGRASKAGVEAARVPAGYSGTPLAKKLGVKDGQLTWRSKMPASVAAEIASFGVSPVLVKTPKPGLALAHVFVTQKRELGEHLLLLREVLAPDGVVWVSWPKKAAGVATDVTEDVVREICLPLGLVDIKVCAVDAVWSGLKLVIRKSERG
jgi:2-methylisocitrate lyase-like PEP mutase family enzyme